MANFIADEGISKLTIETVRRLGHKVVTLKDTGMLGSDDPEIFEYAKSKKLTILTIDKDFGELYYFNRAYSTGVIVVRVKPDTAENITEILEVFLTSRTLEDVDLANSLVILSKWRTRIIR